MTDVFKIAEILVSHAKEMYGDEIGIIAYYGSHAKGTATPTSDLDIYYVPDDGKAESLSTTFVLDDLPYDFWGPPWWMLDEIAMPDPGVPGLYLPLWLQIPGFFILAPRLILTGSIHSRIASKR